MKTLVIGGGMAGLTYAIVALKNGQNVTIAERNARVGKKIAMTGNGKCNIGNANVNAQCFNTSSIVRHVLQNVTAEEYKRFLTSCGIYTYTDDQGRMYPLSDSASNVVDCLRYQFAKFGGILLTDTVVTSVSPSGGGFEVRLGGKTAYFDKVVLACGSRSGAQPVDVSRIVPQGAMTPTVPSLVPVKVRNMDATLNGLRVKADVTLLENDMSLSAESGEVQFKDYGLSGICIFNLSAIIARREVQRKSGDFVFCLDVVPKLSQMKLEQIVESRLRAGERQNAFFGILHNKLAAHILARAGADANAQQIARLAKNLTFRFEQLLDWSMSQVTSGGIAETYLDADTMSLANGVVALGEILNVDGICGGNNLFFASASALCTFTKEQRERAFSLC